LLVFTFVEAAANAACSLRLWRQLGQASLCDQWRERVGKVRLSDLLKRLVYFDGFGCPSGMHHENDGPGAAAARIAAIAFADADYSVVIGVDEGSDLHLQFKRSVVSPIRRFPWNEAAMCIRQPGGTEFGGVATFCYVIT
jgi:hypothetical protein